MSVVYHTLVGTVVSAVALLIVFLWFTALRRLQNCQFWRNLSCFCCEPHSITCSFVSCGSDYHVSVMYLTPVAIVLSDMVLLITFLWFTSLCRLQYCELWRELSCFCGLPHCEAIGSVLPAMALLITFLWCTSLCRLQYYQ